jgi:hypothetical protein
VAFGSLDRCTSPAELAVLRQKTCPGSSGLTPILSVYIAKTQYLKLVKDNIKGLGDTMTPAELENLMSLLRNIDQHLVEIKKELVDVESQLLELKNHLYFAGRHLSQ